MNLSMKHPTTSIPLVLASLLASASLPAAVPLRWTVETSRAVPAQFEAYQGETLALEAALQSYGKPLEAPANYSLYWQTNGMGSTYWSVPCTVPAAPSLRGAGTNVLFATWSPTNDVGARAYNCFIGKPGTIYHAAFQMRLRPSPGAIPNELPLPQKVIDFAKVTVLNPPWSGGGGGGVDTNAVREIVEPMIGAATNAVNIALTNRYTKAETDAKLDGKRDKADRAVYSVTRTENTDWTFYCTNPDVLSAMQGGEFTVVWVDGADNFWLSPNSFGAYTVEAFYAPDGRASTYIRSANVLTIHGEFVGSMSATRPRYMDETLGPAKQNQQLAAVATDDAAKPANGDLMKYDAANDKLVRATAGVDYAEQDEVDNLKISVNEDIVPRLGDLSSRFDSHISDDDIHVNAGEKAVWYNKADRANTLSGYGITDGATKTEVIEAKATANDAKAAANEANVWSSAVYNFMTVGRTNCWFSGTNYVFGTDAVARTRFSWEDGMDAATVPCSMALWEIRAGELQLVWDQRDWTAWYWSFKANQMQTNVTAQIAALGLAVTNDSNYAWAKRYASDGTPNPDASTTFIDTPSVTLSPGMKWETVATVSGAAYWTIVGDGAIIGGSGTNAVLRIQDFEGNDIMTVTKGEHRLAWIERGEITGQMHDGDGWVCFDMLADAEPIGYFSTTLDSSDFLLQTDPNCPAQYEWEDLHNGKYRIHYLLKPGIQSNACFAKFQVEVEGQTIIRYNAGQEISGGLIYNGVKIAPDISGSPAVGTVIQWKVVNR